VKPMSGVALDVSFRAAGHVWWRSVYLYRRSWWINLLPNFFEPVIYLLGMGLGLGAYVGTQMEGMSYIEYLVPGLIAVNAMNGASFETTYNVFVKLRFNRTYEAMTAAPISMEDVVLGEALWATTRGLLYGAIFACMACALQLLPLLKAVLLLPVIALVAFTFSGLGLLFTAHIRTIDFFSYYYTLVLTPLFLLSDIFFPVQDMPAWAQQVAWCSPLFHGVQLAKAVVYAERVIPWGSALGLLVLAMLSIWYAMRRIRDAQWS